MSISSTLVHRADIRFHEAPGALRPFVGCFWVVTAEAGAMIRVVADGSAAMSIQLDATGTAGWVLRGPLVRPDERRFPIPTTMVGVRLRPGVAHLLSGMAAHTMVDRRIEATRIAAFDGLVRQCNAARCLEALQTFLVARLDGGQINGVVAAAIEEIGREHGCLKVAELADRCGVSPRQLNRLMRIWVGYGPKRYASVVRFQESLKQMDDSPGLSASTLASETGYFDQSHLTLNLTRFAGATPGHLAANGVADFSKTRCRDPS
jgi:methylphosphotriester-DNA--protein-cysteine methyltransferase